MRALLKPSDYYSSLIFEQETLHIFPQSWFFVGLLRDIQGHNDWLAGTYGGIPYFIQNVGNQEIRGFLNKCSHRHSIIRREEKGNGCIICPYHGWLYNAHGLPTAIPSKPKFEDLDKNTLTNLSLPQLKIEICGELIFANLSQESPTVQDCLGSAYVIFQKYSADLGADAGTYTYNIKANWKFVQEIALEAYHVDWVHKNSFSKFNFRDPYIEVSPQGSAFLLESNSLDRNVDKLFSDRSNKVGGYHHITLFPCFNISSFFGISYAIITSNPISLDRTEFQVRSFRNKSQKVNDIKEYKRDEYYKQSVLGADVINKEDIEIVEFQQKGIKYAKSPGVLSLEELRILHFHKWYSSVIDNFQNKTC